MKKRLKVVREGEIRIKLDKDGQPIVSVMDFHVEGTWNQLKNEALKRIRVALARAEKIRP